jgi:hypothetical protein
MGQTAKPTRHNRTITVDFHDETTYFALLDTPHAFVEFVLAFLLALGFQLLHKASCSEGGGLTRHSHYARVRLGGLTIWRIQCTTCKAVFTVLPHFVLRYRKMRPAVARDALLATHGGLSLELCAVISHISPMALQIPPDLVVKSQAIDIIGLIFYAHQGKNAIETSRRPSKSRSEPLSLSEGYWFTTKSDGMWLVAVPGRCFSSRFYP